MVVIDEAHTQRRHVRQDGNNDHESEHPGRLASHNGTDHIPGTPRTYVNSLIIGPLKKRAYSRIIGFGLALVVLVNICVPLINGKLNSGHDTLRYLPRLVEFHENIRQGIWIPRWAPDLT